ncbi:MAG TPA: cupredoxin domain-containing protein [Candidatus Acidoferrum sp.]|jgi:cytochrome c oxidase subunit 2
MILKSISATLTLSVALLFFASFTSPAESSKTIPMTASKFKFEPNEITVKKGEEVTLVIQALDATHGLELKDFGVKTDLKKGQSTEVKFTPTTVGTFGGKCAHYCGKGHGSMKMTVHVVE